MSAVSTPANSPDLSLRGVAFARLSEGRVVARGTFERLDYRRSGGRLAATTAAADLDPEPGTGLASFGVLHLRAPQVFGEVARRRGRANGGVHLDTSRGDVASTQRVEYDGPAGVLRSDTPVDARGPGYRVHGNGLVAAADGSSVHLVKGVSGALDLEARR